MGPEKFDIGSRDLGHAHLGSFWGSYPGMIRPPSLYQIWSSRSIYSQVIRGSQNCEIGSRDLGHAHLWVVLWSIHTVVPSSMSVPNPKRTALFVQKLWGSQNFEIGLRPRTRQHSGRFMVHMQDGSLLYVCTKFEADSSIRSKVIWAPKISKLGHITLSHATFEP